MEKMDAKTTRHGEQDGLARPHSVLPGAKPADRRISWAAAAILLIAIGLLLRMTMAGPLPVSLKQMLPWLNPPSVTLYFPDADGRFLVPVTRQLSSGEATAESAVQQLFQGPTDHVRLTAAFPENIRLRGVAIERGVATVDISLPRADAFQPGEAIQALASTLQQFPKVKSVRLVADGSVLGQSAVPPSTHGTHTIYYTYDSYLVPVPVDASNPADALRDYLRGPGQGSALKGLPEDVRLVEYNFEAGRGLVYANFTYTDSVRQLALEDPVGVKLTLTGIIATLTGFPEVKAAMLDFQGHASLGLGQCANLLRSPQSRPSVLNDESTVLKR